MKISNLYKSVNDNVAKISATVIWEDCDHPDREIFFETNADFAKDLTCNPHAFLLACTLPAVRHGEQRINIDEEICPELRNGLLTAIDWITHWNGRLQRPFQIEAKIQTSPTLQLRHAGSFLSGGVDSLATLRMNRLDYPKEHPLSIKDCLVVHGFDIGGYENLGTQTESFNRAMASLENVAQDAGVSLIPVRTNIKHLDEDLQFWLYEFHGAALAAVAHAFSSRLGTVSVASSDHIRSLTPLGSHPLLDPNYSSADLRIRHDGIRLTRLDKVKMIANWDVALDNIRVCTNNSPGKLNCGECEKCIRTMTELLAIGKLESSRAFTTKNVSQEMFGSIFFKDQGYDDMYRELIEPLKGMGRFDLVKVIEQKSAHFHAYLAWKEERDWKGSIKRLDRKYLGSRLIKLREMIRNLSK